MGLGSRVLTMFTALGLVVNPGCSNDNAPKPVDKSAQSETIYNLPESQLKQWEDRLAASDAITKYLVEKFSGALVRDTDGNVVMVDAGLVKVNETGRTIEYQVPKIDLSQLATPSSEKEHLPAGVNVTYHLNGAVDQVWIRGDVLQCLTDAMNNNHITKENNTQNTGFNYTFDETAQACFSGSPHGPGMALAPQVARA